MPFVRLLARSIATIFLIALGGTAAAAGTFNAVASCYHANKIEPPAMAPARELFVLVDQTTFVDDTLKKSVLENVWHFLGPNSSFTIATFSAFSQGRYTEIVSAGLIEAPFPPDKRDSTSVKLLASLDVCLGSQEAWAKKFASEELARSMGGASADLARSDIMAALNDISARVKSSVAREKVVLVVSDMLENSAITSFYSNRGRNVRLIDAAKELETAQSANLIGDFGSARIFVVGAGMIGPVRDTKSTYRDAKTMGSLRDFWTHYFEKSRSKLEEFGQPALLRPIH
jgi:hypothetical protein